MSSRKLCVWDNGLAYSERTVYFIDAESIPDEVFHEALRFCYLSDFGRNRQMSMMGIGEFEWFRGETTTLRESHGNT